MTPKFDGKRWRIQVMREGKRYSFSSSLPGTKGRKEVLRMYESWLFDKGSGQKSVSKVAQEYLEDLKARNGAQSGSYYQVEAYIRLYITPKCASKKICKMTLRDWQSLINEAVTRSGEPLSDKTLRNLRSIIMGLIKFGYEDYQCEKPRGELYIPKGRTKSEKQILQRDAVARLLEPSEEWYHPALCLLVLTGMRPGEVLGLKNSDVSGDSIVIRRAVNDKGLITNCKNENARRVIPIGTLASGIIRKTIRRNERCKLHTEWVFCAPSGAHGTQAGLRKSWNRLKIDRDLAGTVYGLRHTFISLMKNVMPEQMIKDIVGHSVSMDTFGTYGHIIDGEQRRAAKIIDLSFGANQGENLGENMSSSDGLSRT